jgi:excisionase family DNA binding protein
VPNTQPAKRRGRPPGAKNRRSPGSPAAQAPALEPIAVRVAEAAALVGCGVSKMKQLIAAGAVESVKIGTMRLVKVSSLKRLVGE